MNKLDLRIVKTKKNLHQALLHLLKVKPLAHINVTELCQEAEINRGTFYFHYETIGQVFEEMFVEIMLDLKHSYQEPYLHNTEITAKNVDPNTIRIFHHIKKYEEFYRIIFSKDVPMQYYYMFFDEVRSNFMFDVKSSHIQQDPPFLFSYRANAVIGVIIEWYRNDFKQSAYEMNLCLVDLLKLQS